MCVYVKAEGDSVSLADGDAMALDKKDAASDSLQAHIHTVKKQPFQNPSAFLLNTSDETTQTSQ